MRRFFAPFTKIDEETRTVYGTATQEVPDRDDEIMDYDSSKPYIEGWSQYFDDATGGKSLGNVRAMHRNISAGKLSAIEFDDANKCVEVAAKIVDDQEWQKCLEGVYTGFSFAGRTIKRWRDPGNSKLTRYTAKPTELSLADLPAVPTATFDLVKIGGIVEKRGFKKVAERTDTSAAAGESKYGDVVFADEKNKKYPLDTKAHVRNALARWGSASNRTKYSAKDQATIGRKIRAAARKVGIEVSEKAVLSGDFAKGLYDVGQLANTIESLSWLKRSAEIERENEGDVSPIADRICDSIAELCDILEEMTGEEVAELLESIGHVDSGEGSEFEQAAKAAAAKAAGTTIDSTKVAGSQTTSSTTSLTSHSAGSAIMADKFEKISKAHVAKVADLCDHAKAVHTLMGHAVSKLESAGGDGYEMAKAVHSMLGEHVAKIEGFKGEVSGQSTTEPSPDEEHAVTGTEKVAGSEKKDEKPAAAAAAATGTFSIEERFAKIEADLAAEKTARQAAETELEEFAKLGKQMAEQFGTPALAGSGRGRLKIVEKTADGVVADEKKEEKHEKVAGSENSAQSFNSVFKKDVLSKPRFSQLSGVK